MLKSEPVVPVMRNWEAAANPLIEVIPEEPVVLQTKLLTPPVVEVTDRT